MSDLPGRPWAWVGAAALGVALGAGLACERSAEALPAPEASPGPGSEGTPDADSEPAEQRPPAAPEADDPPKTRAVSGAPAIRPCPPEDRWPEGMACVLGGTFVLGSEEGRRDERVPGPVFVQTFFMDRTEVTNAAYEACIEEGRCERPMRFRRFMGPRQPVVAVSWQDAVAHCGLRGARLPTEAEWERAASGPNHTRYPWGDTIPGDPCALANVKTRGKGRGCGQDVTRNVASYPPGHWGLFDMAGNVHEWVQDIYRPCLQGCRNACGAACFGIDPKGPCGGAWEDCPGRGIRSVRGGSWYWPLERARTTARRGSGARNRGPHRFGFRCARALPSAG